MSIPEPFAELIERHHSFLLTGHEHPDGDCLGAEVALFHLLRAMGKECVILNPDPPSPTFDFLAQDTPFGAHRSGDPVPEVDVVCLLDCAFLSRTGSLAEPLRARIAQGAVPAVIDHHVGSEHGDGRVCMVDSTAAATGELVHRLFGHFGVPVGPIAGAGVYVSLVSDTGWFRYSNTDAGVLRLAADLVDAGVDPSAMYDQLFRRNHSLSVDVMRRGLEASQVLLDGRLGVLCLDKAMMDRVNRIAFDTDLLMEPLRSIDGIQVVALLKERFDGNTKLSLRASHDIDVQAIAAEFGGGGHRKAAGATVAQPIAAVLEQVEAMVRQALVQQGLLDGGAAALGPQGSGGP